MIKWDGKWNEKFIFFLFHQKKEERNEVYRKIPKSHSFFFTDEKKRAEWTVLEVEIIIIKQKKKKINKIKLLMDLW